MLLHAHKDVAASEVIEVVGKRTDTVIDVRRVPALLKLYPVAFDLPLIQQIFYVNR
jgi:hypothetical protein